MRKRAKNQPKDFYDIYKSMRRDFGDVKPYTRVFDSKKNTAEARADDILREWEEEYDEENG